MLIMIIILCISLIGYIIYSTIVLSQQSKKIKEYRKENTRQLLEVSQSLQKLSEEIKATQEAFMKLGSMIPSQPNDIEKTEDEDIPLDETIRFPITKDMKIQFEDEQKVMPVNVIAYGSHTG